MGLIGHLQSFLLSPKHVSEDLLYKVLPVMKNDKAPSPKAVRLQWSSRAERRAQSPPGSTSPHVSGHETATQILCVLIPIFPPHTGQVTSASGLCPRSSSRHRRPDLSPGHLQLRSDALALNLSLPETSLIPTALCWPLLLEINRKIRGMLPLGGTFSSLYCQVLFANHERLFTSVSLFPLTIKVEKMSTSPSCACNI